MSEDKQRQALGEITRAVVHLLDSWKLDERTMCDLLALPKSIKARSFVRFREGLDVFPAEPQVLRRAQYLLRIADALRTAYPMNPKMGARWIHQKQRRLGGRTPISIMLSDGETGLAAVLCEVDCTFAWDSSGSRPVTAKRQ